jgi:hypothetical protein
VIDRERRKDVKNHPSPEAVKQVERETYELLDEIGLPNKRVARYERADAEGTAEWAGESETAGVIIVYRGCDPEAVAHEIGHGFHEALNHHKRATLPHPFRYPDDGEAVAEAVRFFVEQRRGSTWRPTSDRQTLEHCRYDLGQFRAKLRELV